ncbi:MAG: helix-turn-helix domain-containing protein [Oscillibacter sp.]|nr:helix-turn-helix domain-containing protein [Oscillibacter sp.]
MATTKENILTTALQLFAKDGYEAVSVSMIAGALGMTKGALYKHYVNKRDIFDQIVTRMEERDAQRAAEFELPEGTLTEMTEKYCSTPINQLIQYSKAQFLYWTQEKFSSDFRKMLTIEQYHSEEMNQLYQQYLASGPLGYVTDLFGSLDIQNPQQEAVAFYAPMFLLYSVYDGSADKAAVIAQMEEHLKAAGQRLKGEKG